MNGPRFHIAASENRATPAERTDLTPGARWIMHPDWPGQRVRLAAIEQPADDDATVAQTIGYMGAFTAQDAQAESIRNTAFSITAGATTESERIARVFAFVKNRVKFVQDAEIASRLPLRQRWTNPNADEVLTRPIDLLASSDPKEDCDGFSMLTAALLRALGYETYFVTIAANRLFPRSFSHVYAGAMTEAGPVALDTSHGPAPGWEYPNATRKQVWPIESMHYPTLGGDPAPTSPTTTKGIDWNSLLQSGMKFVDRRFGTPTVRPGTYVQTDSQGNQTFYGQQPGAGPLSFPGMNVGGEYAPLAVLGVAAVVLAVILKGRG